MNSRIHKEHGSASPGTVAWVCSNCADRYPSGSVCARCCPPDPAWPEVGMPVVDDGGHQAEVLALTRNPLGRVTHFEVQAPGFAQIALDLSVWLVKAFPDFTRPYAWITSEAPPTLKSPRVNGVLDLSKCKCGYPNEYNNGVNCDDGWRCTSCRLWAEHT